MLALSVYAAGPNAASVFKEGRKAEKAGDVVRAYLLYAQAAALDPTHPEYWARSQALRTRAALKAQPRPPSEPSIPTASPAATAATDDLPGPPDIPTGLVASISAADLADLERMKPPPELKASPERKSIDRRGNARTLFEQVAKTYGLETVFDGDYQPGPTLRFRIEDADYREALYALEAATGSFAVPVSERLILVAKDTPQKRADLEPTVAVSVHLPYAVTPQELQEVARGVQQALEIQKLAVDASQQMVVIRDRLSKVRPAQVLFEQLTFGRAQVVVEMQFIEIDRSAFYSYGFLMPNQFPIVYAGRDGVTGAMQSLAKFLFGKTVLGLGIANAQMFANMSKSSSNILLQAALRSVDGQPATFHVGDKYPILTGGFLGESIGVPPTFQFEDLGFVLKTTPRVHAGGEVTLEVEAEFKVLSGTSVNGIPAIANRRLQSKVRLRDGQWAVLAGMMSNTEAKSISGLAGLSSLPVLGALFRQNDRTNTSTEVLVLLKPVLVNPSASELTVRALHVGSEARLKIPL